MQNPSGPQHGPRPSIPSGAVSPPTPRPDAAPIPPALASAIAAAQADAWRDTAPFQAALSAYVAELSASGLDIVQTLLTAKAALRAVPPTLQATSVRWCIEQYYQPG